MEEKVFLYWLALLPVPFFCYNNVMNF